MSEESRGEVAAFVDVGRLDQAAYRARQLAVQTPTDAVAQADAALVEWLRDTDLPRDRMSPWRAAFRLSAGHGGASQAVLKSVRRHLARGFFRLLESQGGRGAFLEGEPAGAVLLEADLPGEAAGSLYESLARLPASGRAALLLGNALHRLGRSAEGRDAYRRALRVAPLEIAPEDVEDPEVRALWDLGAELGLEGDVRPWLPALGWMEDVLPLSALDPVPGDGFGPGTRAYDLLVAHKGARTHAERTAIRRDLKELTPALYAALTASRKLEPGPQGSA